MDNLRTSDPLFGARHPEVSITHVSPMEKDDFSIYFSYEVDGKFFCRISCEPSSIDDMFEKDGQHILGSRALSEAPPTELMRGSYEECEEEANTLYRFLLARWQSHLTQAGQEQTLSKDVEAPAPKLPEVQAPTRKEGLTLSMAGLALLVAIGAWTMPNQRSLPAPSQPDLQAYLSAGGPVAHRASPKENTALIEEAEIDQGVDDGDVPAQAPESESPKPTVSVEVDVPKVSNKSRQVSPAASEASDQGRDLLAAFGVPEPKPVSDKEVEVRLKNEWRSNRTRGVSNIPEPGSLVAQGNITPLSLGGGSLEDISEIKEFGLEP